MTIGSRVSEQEQRITVTQTRKKRFAFAKARSIWSNEKVFGVEGVVVSSKKKDTPSFTSIENTSVRFSIKSKQQEDFGRAIEEK